MSKATIYKNLPNPAVDFYFSKGEKWQEALQQLRNIALSCGLTEELKWGTLCYRFEKANIVLIHTFKEYCALLFFKGALLSDPAGMLIQQKKNVQAARQIRFTNATQIKKQQDLLKAYIAEAIKVERSGLKVALKETAAYPVPEEFKMELKNSSRLEKAFYALTPGRQRGYLLYFTAPVQTKTRLARIEKYKNHILTGKGLNDQ